MPNSFVIMVIVMFGGVGGLVLGALVGIIVSGPRRYKTLRGFGFGSLGGFCGGIVSQAVFLTFYAALPKHDVRSDWFGTVTLPVISEGLVMLIYFLLLIGCSAYFGWIAAKWSLSLPKK